MGHPPGWTLKLANLVDAASPETSSQEVEHTALRHGRHGAGSNQHRGSHRFAGWNEQPRQVGLQEPLPQPEEFAASPQLVESSCLDAQAACESTACEALWQAHYQAQMSQQDWRAHLQEQAPWQMHNEGILPWAAQYPNPVDAVGQVQLHDLSAESLTPQPFWMPGFDYEPGPEMQLPEQVNLQQRQPQRQQRQGTRQQDGSRADRHSRKGPAAQQAAAARAEKLKADGPQPVRLVAGSKAVEQAQEELSWALPARDATVGYTDDEDLCLRMRLENESSASAVLKIAHEGLARMSPETTVFALHTAARQLPAGADIRGTDAEPHLLAMYQHLRGQLLRIRMPRALSRLAWTLGKMDLHTADAEAAMSHVCKAARQPLNKFTGQDLTNTLWGLARFCAGERASTRNAASVKELVDMILTACCQQMESLTSQCLSNSMWAIARLQVYGEKVEEFLGLCLKEMGTKRNLSVFITQGLANIAWALGDLRSRGIGEAFDHPRLGQASVKSLAIKIAEAADERLKVAEASGHIADEFQGFQTQELSMMAWAYAKIFVKPRSVSGKQKYPGPPLEVKKFLFDLAECHQERLSEFSPQSISNLAWAFATLGLITPRPEPENQQGPAFMYAIMATAQPQLSDYTPQAIANVLWAVVRIEVPRNSEKGSQITQFATAVLHETGRRWPEYNWRDLSSIAASLAHGNQRFALSVTFMTHLVGYAADQLQHLTAQMILNIAQSATRLRVPPEAMQGFVNGIAAKFEICHLNDIDKRQWLEVQEYCRPQFATRAPNHYSPSVSLQ